MGEERGAAKVLGIFKGHAATGRTVSSAPPRPQGQKGHWGRGVVSILEPAAPEAGKRL